MSGPYHIREAIYAGQDLCTASGHPQARWVYQIATNGAKHFGYHCRTCDRYVTVERYADKGARGWSVKAEWLAEHCPEVEIASIERSMRELAWRRCQRCRETRLCEDHHWAPQAVFADADQWPIGPLCKSCHHAYGQTLETYIQQRIAAALKRVA